MKQGKVVGINGNMVTVALESSVIMNEVGYIITDEGKRLKSEVIRVMGDEAQLQVFEITKGISIGDSCDFSGDLLAAELGPGLLGQVYDGLQNPLPELAEQAGYFLERGVYIDPLNRSRRWDFTPVAHEGDKVEQADILGTVPEGPFKHSIMVPFNMLDSYTIKSIKPAGSYLISDTIAVVTDSRGNEFNLTMSFQWPVKRAITCYEERLKPVEPMLTKTRVIDTFLPVAKGGTYCIPGPFGAGKTVLQQTTSKFADVDVVIVAACGERAGEVVETLKEFPELTDPKTGKSLMELSLIHI